MADWVNILPAEYEPEAPLTSSLGARWSTNVAAMAEGSEGAPRITHEAMDVPFAKPVAGNAFLVLTLQEAETTTNNSNFRDVDSAPFVGAADRHLGFRAINSGEIRCYLEHKRSSGDGNSQVRIIKNGTVIETWTTSLETYQTRTLDLSIDIGDIIIYQHLHTSGGISESTWRHLRVYADNKVMCVA